MFNYFLLLLVLINMNLSFIFAMDDKDSSSSIKKLTLMEQWDANMKEFYALCERCDASSKEFRLKDLATYLRYHAKVTELDKVVMLSMLDQEHSSFCLKNNYKQEQQEIDRWCQQHFPSEYNELKNMNGYPIELFELIEKIPQSLSTNFCDQYAQQWQNRLIAKIQCDGTGYQKEVLDIFLERKMESVPTKSQ